MAYNWHFTCLDSLQVHNLEEKERVLLVRRFVPTKLSKIALFRGWMTSQLKHALNKNDLEKYFQTGLFYDTLLYLCPIPTKLSIIVQNCLFTGQDDLPAQTCIKHNWFGKKFPSWSVLWHFALSLLKPYEIVNNGLQLTFHVPGQSAGSQFGR
jgi:hypothetical protein